MSADTESTRSAAADAAAAPLDLLLTDAATGLLRRVNPGGSGMRLAAALAARPRLVAGRGTRLAGELARITTGRSQVQPSRRDRRFADPGWAGNPLLRRAMQAYLAAAEAAEGVVAEAGLDEKDAERVGFVLTNLIDALAPSNNPLLNPAAMKAAIDTGGRSVVAGLRHFAADMAAPPRVPAMVEPDAYQVGVDLAVSAGLHRDFLRLGAANALVTPGGATMLGSPVNLAAVDRDTYQVAGITDHICPWQSCYRSTQLLSGRHRFVLSTSGHVAAMVNPPGNDKARYQLAKECPEDSQEWLRHAETCHGSWWPDYADWLAERCGEEKAAPGDLGGGGLTPICDAPGTYVYDH